MAGLIQRGAPLLLAYSTTMPMPFLRSSSLGVPRIQTPGFFISTTASMRSAVPEFQHIHQLRLRHRIAVQGHNLKMVAGQRELNVLGGAGIQEVEQDALSLFDAHRLAIPQALAIDGEALIADFPAVGFLVFLLALRWLRAPDRPPPLLRS